jgi:hypothetical protein
LIRSIAIAACVAAALSGRGETLDRIAVTVGDRVITESQITLDLRVSACLYQEPVDLSGEAKRTGASFLVDQILMLQEAADSHLTLEPEDTEIPGEEECKATLAKYGIKQSDLENYVQAGNRAQMFTDLRFGPEVQISEEDLRAYYNKIFANPLAAGPAQVPSFEDKRDEIEKVLMLQGEMEALDRWLAMARASTKIVYHDKAFQ